VEATAASSDLFVMEREPLLEIARARTADYRHAEPFPSIVIDDFVPLSVTDRCVAEFPSREEAWDLYTDAGNSLKLAISDQTRMGPFTRQLIAEFNGGVMIDFLEQLTGIDGLVPDPHLVGGGMHQLNPGGFLKVHADFNLHERLKLDRRINVLLYLNRDWRDEYGGHLELWTADMGRCARRIAPIAGRIVVFNTTDTSFHGNPSPVACPEGMARRSLAFYYYTNGRPEEERSAAHSTLYQRPGAMPLGEQRRDRSRAVLRDLLPPVLVRGLRRLRAPRRP
jgi:Rps23 Pro-64 3,4-dihydroxylase Tpa1-like proline 4-hydroxylase